MTPMIRPLDQPLGPAVVLCVWKTMSPDYHITMINMLLAQFSLYMYKSGLILQYNYVAYVLCKYMYYSLLITVLYILHILRYLSLFPW